MARALSVNDLLNAKHNTMKFEGVWHEAIGNPELRGAWLIWGNSANGKTRFTLQLCKYLTRFGRVAYDSLEEGASRSMQDAFRDLNMAEVSRRLILLDQEPVADLKERLRKRRSPEIIVIDSIQYSGMNYKDYIRLKDEFKNKLFILISHADGKHPQGRVAKSIRYDSFVKIWVEGYAAFPQSRYGGGTPYIIWEQGALDYWGTLELENKK